MGLPSASSRRKFVLVSDSVETQRRISASLDPVLRRRNAELAVVSLARIPASLTTPGDQSVVVVDCVSTDSVPLAILRKTVAAVPSTPVIALIPGNQDSLCQEALRLGVAACVPVEDLDTPLLSYVLQGYFPKHASTAGSSPHFELREMPMTMSERLGSMAGEDGVAEHTSDIDYRMLVESANSIILRFDTEGRVTFINEFAQRFFGYSEDEILGRNVVGTIVPPRDSSGRDLDILLREIEACPDAYAQNENENMRKNGERVWLAWANRALCDSAGRVREVLCVGTDISARKRVEEARDRALAEALRATRALRESEERYRRITQAVTDYIYTVRIGPGGEIETFHAPACAAVTGYTAEEFASNSSLWIEMVHPDDRAKVTQQAEDVLEDCAVYQLEHRILRKDGKIRWVRNTPVPSYNAAGELISYDGLISDVTERRLAEDALRESEEKYRTVVENAYDGICVVEDGQCVYANLRFATMLGRQVAALPNTPMSDYCDGTIAEALCAERMSVEKGEDTVAAFEGTFRHADGSSIEVDVKISPILYGGRLAQLVIVRDVTEFNRTQRLLAEQRLAMFAASRMTALGVMASGVAHEINNPLAVISGTLEQLTAQFGVGRSDVTLIQRLIDRAVRHTHRIETIVNSLRTVSREGSHDPFHSVAASSLVEDATDLCAERFRVHGIDLNVSCIPEDLHLECRSTQVSQVLVNLLNNAYDAVETLDSKWVRVDVYERGDFVEFSVTDSGGGILEGIQDRIFQPFFTTKDIARGVGLGLSVSRGIAESHGGTLDLDTHSGNTRFLFRLPKQQRTDCPGG